MTDTQSRLAALIDGVPLGEDEARALWREFSEHMDEHRGDMAGFAQKKGWFSVIPEHRQGKAVLAVRTSESAKIAPPPAPKPKPPPQGRPHGSAPKKPQGRPGAKPQGKPGATPQGKPQGKPGAKPQGKPGAAPRANTGGKPPAPKGQGPKR
jgi:hypothetical protein